MLLDLKGSPEVEFLSQPAEEGPGGVHLDVVDCGGGLLGEGEAVITALNISYFS